MKILFFFFCLYFNIQSVIPQILQYYISATQFDKDWYKAWHA